MDWLAAVTGIAGAFLNAHDARLATIVWLISNVAFLCWSAWTGTWSIFVLNAIYLIINVRTLVIRIRSGAK